MKTLIAWGVNFPLHQECSREEQAILHYLLVLIGPRALLAFAAAAVTKCDAHCWLQSSTGIEDDMRVPFENYFALLNQDGALSNQAGAALMSGLVSVARDRLKMLSSQGFL